MSWSGSTWGDGGHQPILPAEGLQHEHGHCGGEQECGEDCDSSKHTSLSHQQCQQHQTWQHLQKHTARPTIIRYNKNTFDSWLERIRKKNTRMSSQHNVDNIIHPTENIVNDECEWIGLDLFNAEE